MWITHLNNYPKDIIKLIYTHIYRYHWVFKVIYSKYNTWNCIQVEMPEGIYILKKKH